MNSRTALRLGAAAAAPSLPAPGALFVQSLLEPPQVYVDSSLPRNDLG
jgi:hypothetical protein